MSSLKTALSIAEVLPTATRLCNELETSCVAIELGGSIRRRRPDVGDIEIVAIPVRPWNLFGDIDETAPTSLDSKLRALHASRRIRLLQFGPRAKKFSVLLPCKIRYTVDLYTTAPQRWPIVLAIRTGPARYSRAFVTPRSHGGLLRNGCRVSDGLLWCENEPVKLVDERHFFEDFVQGGYWPPENRT